MRTEGRVHCQFESVGRSEDPTAHRLSVRKDVPLRSAIRNALRISTCQSCGTSASTSSKRSEALFARGSCSSSSSHAATIEASITRKLKSGGLHGARRGTPPLRNQHSAIWHGAGETLPPPSCDWRGSALRPGTRCATGLPCRVMVMASPCSAARSSSAKRALASVALTSRMFNPDRLF